MFVVKIAIKCILEEKGKLLLMKEASTSSWRPGTWGLPGGKVDENETIIETVHRETQEETGLRVKILGLFQIVELIEHIKNDYRLVHHYVFTVKRIGGKLKTPDHHVAELHWFTKEEAMKMKPSQLAEYYYMDIFKQYFKNIKQLTDPSLMKIWDYKRNKKFHEWCLL